MKKINVFLKTYLAEYVDNINGRFARRSVEYIFKKIIVLFVAMLVTLHCGNANKTNIKNLSLIHI